MHSGCRHRSVRAQSSVIGIVLIIGLTLTAASAVVVFGSTTLEDGKQRSQIGQAEQAMTQFDSRTAQVALGDSDVQTVRFGQGQGTYRVNESAGHITIYHEDWNGTNTSSDEYIYEADLGAVVYENGDTTIAYQGGGVWRRTDGGGASMVSPPELHNRKATLTLPVVRVRGSGSAEGDAQAKVRSKSRGTPIFPDLNGERTPLNEQYNDSNEVYYENPVEEGNMTVVIESRYCEAWRSYFVTRTEGRVSQCQNGTVTAQIVALGAQGDFDVSGSSTLTIRGLEELKKFIVRMEESHRGSSTFNRLDWEMHTDMGDEELSIWFGEADKAKCGESLQLEVTYTNGTSTQQWRNDTAFPLESSSECDDDLYMDANMRNDSIVMESLGDPVTINGETYNSSNPPTLRTIIDYYFEKMVDMDLIIEEHNDAHMSDTSWGTIEYEGGGQVVTFLHVTENEVEVSLN